MQTQSALKSLTAVELMRKLNQHGFSTGYKKLKLMIDAGIFGNAVHKVQMVKTKYIIFEKDIDAWIAEHSVEKGMSADILEFLKMQEAAEDLRQETG